MEDEQKLDKRMTKAGHVIWFNVSVLYSALCAGAATGATSGTHRTLLVSLAVHGGLWAVYRALALIEAERQEKGKPANESAQRPGSTHPAHGPAS